MTASTSWMAAHLHLHLHPACLTQVRKAGGVVGGAGGRRRLRNRHGAAGFRAATGRGLLRPLVQRLQVGGGCAWLVEELVDQLPTSCRPFRRAGAAPS